jgi:hypothetical protein
MFGDLPQVVAAIRHVRQQLSQAQSVAKVKSLRDRAEAIREYAKRAVLGLKTCNQAAEVKLHAERLAGKMLSTMELSHGGRPRSKSRSKKKVVSLARLGISKSQSSRWQLAASVPDKAFRQYLSRTKKAGEELTSEGLLRLARELRGDMPITAGPVKAQNRGPPSDENDDGAGEGREATEVQEEFKEVLAKVTETFQHQKVVTGLLEPVLSGQQEGLKEFEQRYLKEKFQQSSQMLADVIQALRQALAKRLAKA